MVTKSRRILPAVEGGIVTVAAAEMLISSSLPSMPATSPKHKAKTPPFHSPVFNMSLFSRLLNGRVKKVATFLVTLLGAVCMFITKKWGVWLAASLGKPKVVLCKLAAMTFVFVSALPCHLSAFQDIVKVASSSKVF